MCVFCPHAVRVVSKESRRLVLPVSSCLFNDILHQDKPRMEEYYLLECDAL
jgi:hypothetical protein